MELMSNMFYDCIMLCRLPICEFSSSSFEGQNLWPLTLLNYSANVVLR